MNYFELVQNTWTRKAGEVLANWASIQTDDQAKVKLELNDCLRDLWLSYDYIFKDRTITFTTVAGQQDYDIPFDGKLKENGLLLQLPNLTSVPEIINVPLKYCSFQDEFLRDNEQGQPRKFIMFDQKIRLHPIPDISYTMTCLYETHKWAVSITNVNQDSLTGHNQLYVASTQEFNVGDVVYVARNTSNEETGVISAITVTNQATTAGYFTLAGNLTFTHTSAKAEAVQKEKQDLTYQNDQPNFPSEYHNILCYMALTRMFYNDPARCMIYQNAYCEALSNIVIDSENSQDGGQRIRLAKSDWIR